MTKKNVRNMKVCGQSGYKYETVPAITLKGKWLEELGFHLGDYVQVKCENGQLIIMPDVNKAQEQEAKTAFMDEEIKKLKVRYPNEKEEITAKYVAEQSAGCYGKKRDMRDWPGRRITGRLFRSLRMAVMQQIVYMCRRSALLLRSMA